MTTDVSIMGPHAIESYRGRMLALEQFGVTPHALMLNDEVRSVAKISRNSRALAVQEDHAVATI